MRAIQVSEYIKSPSQLKVAEVPTTQSSPDEYLVHVQAAAANFFDILQIQGKYQHQPPFPWIGGAEFAGTVLATPTKGSSHKYKVGDRVFGSAQGSYATHVLAVEANLRLVPKGWDFIDAAGLMITAPTSYSGLVTRANIKAGDWVLVHAAAGGVGLAAVQIAKAFGATVVATAGSKRKLEVAREFGADHVVDYKASDWPDQIKKLTPKGRGVDIVYDPVGMIEKSLKCIAWNGRVIVIGFTSGNIEKVAANRILLKNASVVGLHWGMYRTAEPDTYEKVWSELYELISAGKFRSTVYTDRKFSGLDTVGEALELLGRRDTWGKVIVDLTEESNGRRATKL